MCGIAGLWSEPTERMEEIIRRMSDRLRHRGPDDSGVWIDPAAGLGLGHRRLSILDLSPEGHQPMVSRSGRYVIVFNGEIYNFRELRGELGDRVSGFGVRPSALRLRLEEGSGEGGSGEKDQADHGAAFRGHSDTEVMLAAFEAWGIEAALRRFVGMFAFAVWDRTTRQLTLARDHLGIKPLYYGWTGTGAQRSLVFASELSSIRACPMFHGEIDRGALSLLLRHNCIPAPYSIYRGISKLLPGSMAVFTAAAAEPRFTAFWSARAAAEAGARDPFTGSDAEAIDQLERLLREAVSSQMVSDVPLGAFLSGGVDSSVVVALMQAQSGRPVRTFTIGFEDPAYDEADHARAVARHLGTDHTEHRASAADALAVIPRLATTYDEPFADSSQIPTFLVSQLARRDVTVSLSGDGGDELFAGYNRHAWVNRVWRTAGPVPAPLRRLGARAVQTIPTSAWNTAYRRLEPLLPPRLRQRMPGYKLHKLAEMLAEPDIAAGYRSLSSHWKDPAAVVLGATEPSTLLGGGAGGTRWDTLALRDPAEKMMLLDMLTYLPDDILTKVDRASMAVSLESRVPLLDHRVVEFAWRLPLSMKLRAGQGKWALRQVLYRYVPKDLIERPKSGFGIPLDSWLRGPLRDWAESLLDEKRLAREGFFHPAPIRRKWTEHLHGRGNWQYHLWDVLMFQAWLAAEGGEG